MWKRVCALLTATLMLVCLTACGNGTRSGQVLDAGWIVRGDADGVGENEGWNKGFTDSNDVTADVIWYANKFAASLTKGDRVMLTLCDLGSAATVWLNGKQVDTREDAMGDYYVDVTDAVKRVGTNNLVIRSTGGAAGVTATGLSVRPAVMIADIAAVTDRDNAGYMAVTVTLNNGGDTAEVALVAELTALDTGKVLTRVPVKVQAGAGETYHTLGLQVDDYIPWDYDNPYLYNVTVTATVADAVDTAQATVGFRSDVHGDSEGVYTLNGKPFMLRIVDLPQAVMNNDKTMRYFVDFVRSIEFNAIYPLSTPTQALLDYADATGMMIVTDSSVSAVIGADAHVSPITVDLSQVEAVGAQLQYPATQPVELTDEWYADMDLARLYGGAIDAYKAAGDLHVQQLCAAIAQARLKDTNVVRVSGAIAGYPDSMLESVSDAIEELRYVIDVDPVIVKGGTLDLKIDLVDHNVLWEEPTFAAYVKVTGESGILWEDTVDFTTEISALGHSSRLIPLVDESIRIDAPAGKYTVAVELTNLAHPTCGEADFYVVDRASLADATVVNGTLTADAKAAAEAGGKVIVLGANAESGLPIHGTFVTGATGGVVDNRVNAAFAGSMIPSGFDGVNFDTVFVGERGTNILSGFGFTADGGLTYGAVISTYPFGNGSITVVTADVDINNPTVAALLAAAIA